MKFAKVDSLLVYVADSRAQMGRLSGQETAAAIRLLLDVKETINVMFAAAPSQDDVLSELCSAGDIDWSRVNAFHMDEYIGLSRTAPQGFGNYLREHVFDRLPFRQVFYINPEAEDPEAEAQRYEKLLLEHPMDVCILGVGENGHMAFNDPAEARFDDPRLVKTVHLDERCRQQQVNDGCFSSIGEVPKTAITVTIPGLLRARSMFCVVPTVRKAEAVARMLTGGIAADCPATALRRKNGARLYLDPDAASLLQQGVAGL